MGKASRTKQDSGRREKIAAQREAERRQERRNRLLIAGSAIAVVVIVIVVFVVVKANNKSSAPSAAAPSAAPTGAALNSVVSTLTSLPTSVTDAAGSGGSQMSSKPTPISGAPLTANGKPEMLYVGAEYCPYCAAERWSMIVALSRFGTFSGLKPMTSAAKNGRGTAEVYPNTSTWTFYKSSYTSSYLTFTPAEVETNIPDTATGGYTPLQTLTSAQNSTFTKYNSTQAFPFVDFGNKYTIVGASYSPAILAHLTWSQIAADLSKPTSTVAMGIDGTANYITAAICKLTNDQPATACTSTVKGLQSQL
jgi:hypothetical protein